jgi:hypothetical protein
MLAGAIKCIGDGEYGQSSPPISDDFASVACSDTHTW